MEESTPTPGTPTQPTTAQTRTPLPAIGTLSVHFIDVGQSSSTLVVGPTGETILIDTGHYHDGGDRVLSYLRAHGISRLDYLVATHADADHIGGHAAVIDYYESHADGIGVVYDAGVAADTQTYREYCATVERHGIPRVQPRAGDTLPFPGIGTSVAVLGPAIPTLADRDRNENCIVLKLAFGQTSFLLTGDAGPDQEQYLVDHYGSQLEATVLKAGHHGCASSTGTALLDATAPEAVVVSAGRDNPYGHPADETLARLDERGAAVCETATHGDVVFTSDGQGVTIETQWPAPELPTRLCRPESMRSAFGRLVAGVFATVAGWLSTARRSLCIELHDRRNVSGRSGAH